jgi:hypothetical protein
MTVNVYQHNNFVDGKWKFEYSTTNTKGWICSYPVDESQVIEWMENSPFVTPMSREEYLDACTKYGIDPVEDSELGTYGDQYGNYEKFYGFKNQKSHLTSVLRQSRWFGIKKSPQPKKPLLVELVKCKCGHSVPSNIVMNASMGTSCPDCYDSMSN